MLLTKNAHLSYKIGVDEVSGLKAAMKRAMMPITDYLKTVMYWVDPDSIVDWAEYKSRDGFIPHSHNLGGLQIWKVIPKCEEYDFSFLEFGECDTPDDCQDECLCESEGYLDASFRLWFKLESIDESGLMYFYLVLAGGNGDAPYFRTHAESTYYAAEFSCASVLELPIAAKPYVNDLLKTLKGAR